MSTEMDWLRFIDVGVYLAFAVVVGFYWQFDRHHILGAAVSISSFYLWMLARRQIGSSFAVRAQAKKLVTHGLYSKIRNPIYLFGGLAFFGEFVAMRQYVTGTVFLVASSIGQYLRIKREKQVLTDAFGDEYRAYKAKTWF
jgi:protein-S-isoprenylcysteine O-methyltransferase Ste14